MWNLPAEPISPVLEGRFPNPLDHQEVSESTSREHPVTFQIENPNLVGEPCRGTTRSRDSEIVRSHTVLWCVFPLKDPNTSAPQMLLSPLLWLKALHYRLSARAGSFISIQGKQNDDYLWQKAHPVGRVIYKEAWRWMQAAMALSRWHVVITEALRMTAYGRVAWAAHRQMWASHACNFCYSWQVALKCLVLTKAAHCSKFPANGKWSISRRDVFSTLLPRRPIVWWWRLPWKPFLPSTVNDPVSLGLPSPWSPCPCLNVATLPWFPSHEPL